MGNPPARPANDEVRKKRAVKPSSATSVKERQTSADKTLEILMALGELGLRSGGAVRLTDLVEFTGHSRPTVHRLLGELRRAGFANQDDDTGRYRLGPKLLVLSAQCMGGLDLRRIAQPLLKDLVDRIGYTAHLGIRDRQWVVFIDKAEARQGIRIASTIGQQREATTTALGKAILAYSSPQVLDEVLSFGLTRRTPHSITTAKRLAAELKATRTREFSVDNEEYDLGIRCVAAPVFDHAGTPIAAVSVTMLTSQVSYEDALAVGKLLVATTRKISSELGGHSA